jgi:hypothetical protein
MNLKQVEYTRMPQQSLCERDAGCMYLSTNVLTGLVGIGIMESNGTFIYHSVACWFGDEYAA